MSRKNLAFAFLILACAAAPAALEDSKPVSSKLVFTYPCRFAYADGKSYEGQVLDYQCDYMHATIAPRQGADDFFNKLPSLAAQRTFLENAIGHADAAHDKYIMDVATLLKETGQDGATILNQGLPRAKKLDKLVKLQDKLWTQAVEISKPFLWPPREQPSYVQPTAGFWPPTWMPYLQPVFDHWKSKLEGNIQAGQKTLIDEAQARAEALEKTIPLCPDVGIFNQFYDGVQFPPMVNAIVAEVIGPRVPLTVSPGGAVPISDLKTAEPPIPKDNNKRSERNYFSRSITEGVKRLEDDLTIRAWQTLGITHTVGKPYGKLRHIVEQKGLSCSIWAQAWALLARDHRVDIKDLAEEAYLKGYYVEYKTVGDEQAGGTPFVHLNSLLKDHNVPNTLILGNAEQKDLDASLRATGDAIVTVTAKLFWNDSSLSDAESHAVYITGGEMDNKGKFWGYYVNDTGYGEAGRFVSAELFLRAWEHNLVSFHVPRI